MLPRENCVPAVLAPDSRTRGVNHKLNQLVKVFFLLSMKREFRFCVTREELELLTDIRDFTTLFYVILTASLPNGLSSVSRLICNVEP